ncbi:Uncharacterized protein HZ326_29329 [Fusarium oxysporum f. sp. albedinis]|nr:Uncharacterized protein HZ326_29329 [Fusarium oxysporum f. sp. albedinis]
MNDYLFDAGKTTIKLLHEGQASHYTQDEHLGKWIRALAVCTAALWHHVPMPPSQSRSRSEGALSSVAAKTAGSRVVFITSSLDRFNDRMGAPAPSCILWCLVVESVTHRQRARSRRQQHKYCRTTITLLS